MAFNVGGTGKQTSLDRVEMPTLASAVAEHASVIDAGVQAERKASKCSYTLSTRRRIVGGVLTWALCFALLFGSAWSVTGSVDGLPGGKVFSIVILYVCAVLGGWIADAVKLPPLLGMLLAGLALRNIPKIDIVGRASSPEWGSALRTLALTILLLRAGLGLDPVALKKLKVSVILLGTIPVLVETVTYAVLARFMLSFGWAWGFLLGFVIAAVSAAIIVPGMLLLQQQESATASSSSSNGIPTLAIAAASLDNVIAIIGVGISLAFALSTPSSMAWKIEQGPLEIVVGIAYGIVVGILLWYIPDRRDTRAPLFRFGLLLGFGTLAIFGSKSADLSGGGALGCLILAFVAGIGWRRRPLATYDGTLTTTLETRKLLSHLWLALFQPLLFVLIGITVGFDTIDWSTLLTGLALLAIALAARFAATFVSLAFSGLMWREQVFVAIAWLSKASVQAALAPLALDMARQMKAPEQQIQIAQQILTLAVLSIVITAPLGAIGLKWGAVKLLKPFSAGSSASHVINREV